MAKRRSLGIFSGLGGSWSKGLLIVLIALSAGSLVLDSALKDKSPFYSIKRMVADGTRSAMTVLSAPLRTLNQISNAIASNWQAARRVRVLEQDNRNLMQWRDLALALHEKMNRYEELLGAPKSPTPVVITARAISDSGGPFVRARLINVGTDEGVAEGQAVVSYNGLIGRVMSAGKRVSRVLLLTDLNSRVPVFITDIDAHAILAGDNSGTPRLVYIERGVAVEDGMRVMTSGEDGVLPRGLAVGEVARTGGKEWRVRLFAKPDRADFVSVLEVPPIRFIEDNLKAQSDEQSSDAAMSKLQTSKKTPPPPGDIIARPAGGGDG